MAALALAKGQVFMYASDCRVGIAYTFTNHEGSTMYVMQVKEGFIEILREDGSVAFRLQTTPSNWGHAFELLENLNRGDDA